MKVFQCDRCKDVYEANKNDLLRKIIKPIFSNLGDDWSISYIQFSNKSLDIKTSRFNLCDKCITDLYNWMFKEKS